MVTFGAKHSKAHGYTSTAGTDRGSVDRKQLGWQGTARGADVGLQGLSLAFLMDLSL